MTDKNPAENQPKKQQQSGGKPPRGKSRKPASGKPQDTAGKKKGGGRSRSRKPGKPKPVLKKTRDGRIVDPQAERESSNYENPIASRELILQTIHQEGAMDQDRIEELLDLRSEESRKRRCVGA